MDNVREHERYLFEHAWAALAEIDRRQAARSPDPDEHAAVISFVIDGIHRTTWPPSSTARGWRCAPATTARSR